MKFLIKVLIALQLPEEGNNGRSTVQEDVMTISSFDDNDEDRGSSIFSPFFFRNFRVGILFGHLI